MRTDNGQLARRMQLDVLAQLRVELQGFVDAGVEHAEPVGGGLFELGHIQQVAGLHDDLERIGKIMRETPDLERQLFRDLLLCDWFVSGRKLTHSVPRYS